MYVGLQFEYVVQIHIQSGIDRRQKRDVKKKASRYIGIVCMATATTTSVFFFFKNHSKICTRCGCCVSVCLAFIVRFIQPVPYLCICCSRLFVRCLASKVIVQIIADTMRMKKITHSQQFTIMIAPRKHEESMTPPNCYHTHNTLVLDFFSSSQTKILLTRMTDETLPLPIIKFKKSVMAWHTYNFESIRSRLFYSCMPQEFPTMNHLCV